MKRPRSRALYLGYGLLFSLISILAVAGCSKPDLKNPGTRVETINLLDQEGVSRSLADFEGAPVLVYFYPKNDTPGCTAEACGLRDAWGRYQRAGIHVVGVSSDGTQSHAKFVKKHNLPFTLLSDPDGDMAKAFGVPIRMGYFARASFLLDDKGIIREVYPTVDPAIHADEVLKDAERLGLTHSNEM